MRKNVKPLWLLFAILLSLPCFSQIRLVAPDPFIGDLKKIIADFPDHFHAYRGAVIVSNPQSTNYACVLRINGAEEATITTYSGKKEIASWQAVLLTTEDFSKAKQKFKTLFNQINNISVGSSTRLQAKYEAPEEQNKFTSIVFSPTTETGTWSRIRTELLLEFNSPMEWKIRVLVYDMEKADEEETGVKDAGVR